MSDAPHPIGNPPPPPGKAERLVAQSGFVVYEGGSSLFDESVLVYVARTRDLWPEFDIYDHVGRPLGYSRNVPDSGPVLLERWSQDRSAYYDHGHNELLRVANSGNSVFNVTGGATCRVVSEWKNMGNMIISANNEPYGAVVGPRYRGLTDSTLRILDARQAQVGAIKVLEEGRWPNSIRHYVVSVEAGLRGELRSIAIAVPTMVAVIKEQQNS